MRRGRPSVGRCALAVQAVGLDGLGRGGCPRCGDGTAFRPDGGRFGGTQGAFGRSVSPGSRHHAARCSGAAARAQWSAGPGASDPDALQDVVPEDELLEDVVEQRGLDEVADLLGGLLEAEGDAEERADRGGADHRGADHRQGGRDGAADGQEECGLDRLAEGWRQLDQHREAAGAEVEREGLGRPAGGLEQHLRRARDADRAAHGVARRDGARLDLDGGVEQRAAGLPVPGQGLVRDRVPVAEADVQRLKPVEPLGAIHGEAPCPTRPPV